MRARRLFAWGFCATLLLPTAPARAESGAAQPASVALVRGRLTIARLSGADVVVAIDQSNSSLFASGVDVDGDSRVGRNRGWLRAGDGYGRHPASWTSDPSDTVFAAEVGAAIALVDALAERSRFGVLTFRDAVKVRAPVGSAGPARRALQRLRASSDWSGTNLARALDIAQDMLESAAAPDRKIPPRAIVLFTDGRPTAPDGRHWASLRAIERAQELASRGIAVFAVPIGEDSDPAYLAQLAIRSGGSVIAFDDLRTLVTSRIPSHFDQIDLAIENLTLQRPASEVRVHADGSFDGIVGLADGENLLEIRADLGDGRVWSEHRRVHLDATDAETAQDAQESERQIRELRETLRGEPHERLGDEPQPAAP